MFAVIVAGRLVETDVTQVEETKFMFNLMNVDTVNHIVVFLTGQQPFPNGFGGSVYFNWPSPEGESTWQLMGSLTNEKPSAIFKISQLKRTSQSQMNFPSMSSIPSPNQPHHAQLGISLEPLTELAQQVPAISTNYANQGNTYMDFGKKMLTSFYNFASSFSVSKEEIAKSVVNQSEPSTSTYYLPVSVLEKWHTQFQTKMTKDINFWKS